jgi:hypothetical protein
MWTRRRLWWLAGWLARHRPRLLPLIPGVWVLLVWFGPCLPHDPTTYSTLQHPHVTPSLLNSR